MREGKSAAVIPKTRCFGRSIMDARMGEWAGVKGRINAGPSNGQEEEKTKGRRENKSVKAGGEKRGDKVKDGRIKSERGGIKRCGGEADRGQKEH